MSERVPQLMDWTGKLRNEGGDYVLLYKTDEGYLCIDSQHPTAEAAVINATECAASVGIEVMILKLVRVQIDETE